MKLNESLPLFFPFLRKISFRLLPTQNAINSKAFILLLLEKSNSPIFYVLEILAEGVDFFKLDLLIAKRSMLRTAPLGKGCLWMKGDVGMMKDLGMNSSFLTFPLTC